MTVNDLAFSHIPETLAAGKSQPWGAVGFLFGQTRRSRLLVLAVAVIALNMASPSYGQSVFNCSSGFASSGTCGVGIIYPLNEPFAVTGANNGATPGMSGAAVELIPGNGQHNAMSMNYSTPVSVQAFSTTFTFQMNGYNIAFVAQNNNLEVDGQGVYGKLFSAGAGCEDGFYQAFPSPAYANAPNNIFALDLDASNGNTPTGGFTYSNVQVYQAMQSPCNGNDGQSPYASPLNRISTYPVSLDSPVTTTLSCVQTVSGTCDTYSATITYDGTNLSLCLYDVTAANGSCSSSTSGSGTYFQQTWSAINIPSLVGSNMAYIGLIGGTNAPSGHPLVIDTWSYTVDPAPSSPSLSTYTTQPYMEGQYTVTANPTFSPAAGTYSGSQNVTLASTTPGSYICYVASAPTPAYMPQVDGRGGCTVGTLYSGTAIAVSSTETIYAMAQVPYENMPSATTTATYTISDTVGSSPAPGPPTTLRGTVVIQ